MKLYLYDEGEFDKVIVPATVPERNKYWQADAVIEIDDELGVEYIKLWHRWEAMQRHLWDEYEKYKKSKRDDHKRMGE